MTLDEVMEAVRLEAGCPPDCCSWHRDAWAVLVAEATRRRAPEQTREGGGPTIKRQVVWSVSSDQESFHGRYDSREEAISEARSELGIQPGDTFWSGMGEDYIPLPLDVDRLFEELAQDANDNVGESAEDWRPEPDDQCVDEVNAAVTACLIRKGDVPTFWVVDMSTIQRHTAAPTPPAPAETTAKPCPECNGTGNEHCLFCNDGGVTGDGGDCRNCSPPVPCKVCKGTGDAPAPSKEPAP